MPQIVSLAIRSGNGLLLKGGKEALHSNRCIHSVITSCLEPSCTPALIGLVESRGEIDELLAMKEYIDLVVPRGSNALVSHIQKNTSIPVLGHADGICHIYVDENVDIEQARPPCSASLFKIKYNTFFGYFDPEKIFLDDVNTKKELSLIQQMTVVLACMPEPFQPFQTSDKYTKPI